MPPDFFRQLLQLFGRDDTSAPYGDELAGLDDLPGVDGLAASYITILDFTFVGKVSRTVILAHETSACRAERGAPQYMMGGVRPLPA
jgi:hypothetical protein